MQEASKYVASLQGSDVVVVVIFFAGGCMLQYHLHEERV